MIGEVLGSYRVVSQLGAGGMGSVWLAEHQLLGSRAAIKVLLPEMSEQRRIVERFFDEARAATRIDDPGIVTVLDFGWHGASAYIVMEHLTGETVTGRLVRRGVFPLQMALRLLQHCAIAMAAAHARGIVHRDLKPDNIFIVSDPAVPGGERTKILDFGIAKLLDGADPSHSRTKTGVIMGTPAYMSPEQCRGAGGVDHRTDIYALGCVLFHMLIGRTPFVAASAGELIASHLREDPEVPSALRADLPAAVDALVLRCLAKSPDARFQSMTELVRAIAELSHENASIETIPPRLASQPSISAQTVATEPPRAPPVPDTTLRGATGETLSRARPWRGGLLVAALALSSIGVVAFVATRERSAAPPPAASPSAPLDAAVAMPLASPPADAAPAVAIEPPDAAPAKRPPRPRPRRPGAALPRAEPPPPDPYDSR